MAHEGSFKKDVFSGFFWKFTERVSAQLVTLIISVVLARLLVPEDYSVVSVVSIFFVFCNVIVSGGLNQALIQKKNADIKDYSTVLHLTMIMSALLYTVMFAAAPMISRIYEKPLLVPVIRVMSLTFFINAFNSVLSAYTSSHLQFRKVFVSTMAGTTFSAVVGIVMALKGFGPWALVAQQMTSGLIGTLVLYATTRIRFEMKISMDRFKGLFGYGSKIFVSSLISVLYDQINPLIIGLKYSATDLAYYTKGANFPGLINSTISETLSSVLFPAMARVQHDREQVLQITRRYIRTASFIVFPVMAGFFAVATNFVSVVLTDKWQPSTPYIQIFCFAHMFNIIQVGNLQAIKAIGRSDIVLKLEIIKKSIYFAIILVFVFLSQSPIMLALTSIACTLVATVVNTYPNRKLIGYRYRYQVMDLLPNFVQAVVMCLVVMPMGKLALPVLPLLLLQIVTGAAVYVLLSIVTRNENFKYLLHYVKAFLKKGK